MDRGVVGRVALEVGARRGCFVAFAVGVEEGAEGVEDVEGGVRGQGGGAGGEGGGVGGCCDALRGVSTLWKGRRSMWDGCGDIRRIEGRVVSVRIARVVSRSCWE